MKALVVLSGGQDSTTCLALARAGGLYTDIHAITFDYGQTHSRELNASAAIAKLFGVSEHHGIRLGPILQGTSPLTNRAEKLEQYSDFESMDKIIGNRVEKTFVPMRNDLFLTLAFNYAAVHGIKDIWTGVCEADNANYPDCREVYIRNKEFTSNKALGYDAVDDNYITITTPLMHLSKAASIHELARLGLDQLCTLAFSHTAYDGQYPPIGHDHATILRAQGFLEADLPDPLVVRAFSEGLLKVLPDTRNYDFGVVQKMLPHIEKHRETLTAQGVAP